MFKLYEDVGIDFMPTAQTKLSAGFDVKSRVDKELYVGETALVPTGVFIDQVALSDYPEHFLQNHYIGYHLRSGLGLKGLIQPNSVGVIDLDYPGEICGIIFNASGKKFDIKKGDRIGQLVILQHHGHLIGDKYRIDRIRDGGFGSTGTTHEA